LILPAHLVHMGGDHKTGLLVRIQRACNGVFDRFIEKCYLPWNRACIRNRYITVSGFVAALIVTIGVMGGGFVRVVFLPEIPSDFIQASVTMVEGSPEEQTRATMNRVEEAAMALNGQFEFTDSETGERSTKVVEHFLIVSSGVASGTAAIELDKDVPSQVDSDLMTDFLLRYVGNMPGLKTITFSSGMAFGGSPIAFQLVSDNPDQLTAAANELEAKLRSYNGLINVRNEAVNNKDELRLSINPQAEVMGLTLNDISSQVRNAFYGSQAQRMQRGDDEVRVMVRYPKEQRRSIGNLEDMYIRTDSGDLVPFDTVANFSLQPGYSRINRVEGERAVSLRSDIIEAQVEPGAVVEDLQNNFFPELFQRYPAVSVRSDGGTAEQQSIIQDMMRGMMLAIFGIYALLAIPLRSYTQPLIIMGVIPFGAIGAVFGHWLIGIPLNFLSILGIIALSGVVVNDSIVVVDFVNQAKKEGTALLDAVLNAGAARFRAIMLTSMTTFAGLFPILMETSMQAQFLIPMATSLAFGILFATVITLFLIPSLYVILEDLTGKDLRAEPALATA
jgi:multidrug efflux pump subunit AcrB